MVTRGASRSLIVTHAVFTGLTPLIPLPFIDDMAKTYFERRLTRALARAHGYDLDAQEIKSISDEEGRGCLRGCLVTALLYPLEKVFRKIFYFLEWKRAVDTASKTYYRGYLLETALQERWCAPAGPRTPAEVRAAIDRVLDRLNTSLVERAVRGTFNQSRSALASTAGLLQRALRRAGRRASQEEVAEAIESIEGEKEDEINGVIARLQSAIASVPAEHFDRLRAELAVELGLKSE